MMDDFVNWKIQLSMLGEPNIWRFYYQYKEEGDIFVKYECQGEPDI